MQNGTYIGPNKSHAAYVWPLKTVGPRLADPNLKTLLMFNFFSKTKEPIKFWFSTDIHAHILPGVDDGSPDVETSLRLVSSLRDLGIGKILASPHIARDTFENSQAGLDNALATLTAAMKTAGVDGITVDRHSENRIDDLFLANLNQANLKVLPGNYILIENSFVQEPWDLDQVIFDLKVRGYNPILAHPERYMYYHRSGDRYRNLHKQVLFQVNVLSLSGYYGKDIKRVAEKMMDDGMIDFLGTDTHGMRHIDNFVQYLSTRDAERHARKLAGTVKNNIFD